MCVEPADERCARARQARKHGWASSRTDSAATRPAATTRAAAPIATRALVTRHAEPSAAFAQPGRSLVTSAAAPTGTEVVARRRATSLVRTRPALASVARPSTREALPLSVASRDACRPPREPAVRPTTSAAPPTTRAPLLKGASDDEKQDPARVTSTECSLPVDATGGSATSVPQLPQGDLESMTTEQLQLLLDLWRNELLQWRLANARLEGSLRAKQDSAQVRAPTTAPGRHRARALITINARLQAQLYAAFQALVERRRSVTRSRMELARSQRALLLQRVLDAVVRFVAAILHWPGQLDCASPCRPRPWKLARPPQRAARRESMR